MIDTDKYEGHTEAPWALEHLEDDEGQQWFEVPAVHYTTKQSGDGSQQEYTDAQLIADAPLFLEEVKQLREAIEGYKAIWDYLDPKGYAWEEEEFVALLKEHGFEVGEEE